MRQETDRVGLLKVSNTCLMLHNLLLVSVHVRAFLCSVFTVIPHMLIDAIVPSLT